MQRRNDRSRRPRNRDDRQERRPRPFKAKGHQAGSRDTHTHTARAEGHEKGPKPSTAKASPTALSSFPEAWNSWVDELIPGYVKHEYSPKESWRDKPFEKQDARFFLRGIQELSDLFTQERPKDLPPYFRHPRFRSAYLLYFVPLQAAKFVLLFQQHAKAVDAALAHAKKTGALRIADLGAGPGTASFALMMVLLERWKRAPDTLPTTIELTWLDTNFQTLDDGRKLFQKFCESHPELASRTKLRTETAPWWKAPQLIGAETSIVLMGNVLNEASDPTANSRPSRNEEELPIESEIPREWKALLEMANGGGILMIDPAARQSSQRLSRIRDMLLPELKLENEHQTLIWGPCLHLGSCPLAQGRDWCHFSVPLRIPGKWFRDFSIGLGSERQWVKFSYLWIASRKFPAPAVERTLRRVISDPLGPSKQDILICEPGKMPRKYRSGRNKDLRRGDVIRLAPKNESGQS